MDADDPALKERLVALRLQKTELDQDILRYQDAQQTGTATLSDEMLSTLSVAVRRLDLQLGPVSIVPGEDWLGHASHEDESDWSKESANDVVTVALAGYAALAAAGEPTPDVGCVGDFGKAQDLLDRWGLGNIDEWKARTIELMRRPNNVKAVAVVAEHLLVKCRLEGDYVDALVELADEKITPEEFAKFEFMYRRAYSRE